MRTTIEAERPAALATASDGDSAPPPARRWRATALVAAGWVVVLAVVLLRPGGAVHADVTEHPRPIGALAALAPGTVVEQPFTAGADGLSGVTVRVGTYAQRPSCQLRSELLDAGGTSITDRTWGCDEIDDDAPLRAVSVAPVSGSAGRRFTLRLTVVSSSEPVTLRAADPTAAVPVATRSDDPALATAIELHTDYGDDTFAASQVGTALDRIGTYGPFWNRPVALVLIALAAIGSTIALTRAPGRTALVLVALFAATKGLVWAAAVPEAAGVDEYAHVAYAQHLAVDRAIPKRDHPSGPEGPYSASLTTLLDAVGFKAYAPGDRPDYGADAQRSLDQAMKANSDEHADGNGAAAGYTPAYYAVPALIDAVSPGTVDVRIGAMRLWSIALGVVTAVASVLVGRRLFPRHPAAAVLLGVAVAMQPQLSQQTAIVNNDALLIAAGAVCTLVAVALTDPARSRRWALGAGLALGVAMLAKPNGIAFAPVLALAWLIGRRRGARSTPWAREVLAAALGLAGTYGLWFAFATLGGYSGVGLQPDVPGAARGPLDFLHVISANRFDALQRVWVDQLWGDFSWVNVPFPHRVEQLVLLGVLAGLAVVAAWLAVAARDRVRGRRAGDASLADSTVVCLSVVACTVGGLMLLMYEWFHRRGDLEFVQGRYALMMVPAMLALPVLALRRLAPRLSPVVPMAAIATAMALLNVTGLGIVVERFYL